MKKLLLALAITVVAVIQPALAYDFSAVAPSGQTLYYNIISDSTVEVTSQNLDYPCYSGVGPAGVLIIPDTVTNNGTTYSVISIGYSAFYDCDGLTFVTIPNSVTSIGSSAFEGCSGLTSVTIPDSVISIGNAAFYGCSGLTSVTIPNSVTSIGSWAFYYCSGLTSVTIPNSVTSIGEEAFEFCSGLTSVTIPNSVTSIGEYAFGYCSGLTSVIIPNSVTSIGSYAFYYCSGLTSVTIPNSVTSIGEGTFEFCSGLTSVTIPNSVISIGEFAFDGCSGLTSVTIPNSVISIGRAAFMSCSRLTSITIPNSITSIEREVFYYCTRLDSVIIPNSVTSIGEFAFDGCRGLTSITIPNSVTSIGNYAFYNSSLSKVYLKGINPPSIGNDSFYEQSLPNFYVPCQSVSTYQNALRWNNYSSQIYGKNYWEHLYSFVVNDSIFGSATFSEVDCDSNVVVTVNENVGYRLIGWSDGETGNPRTFHLTGDTVVTAILDYIPYSVTVQPNDTLRGIVMGNDTVHYGDTVVIAATANYGYHFSQWNDTNTNNPRTIVVTNDNVYTAIFDKNNYNIALSADTNIHGYMTGMGDYEYLDNRTISAVPNYGYHFTHWNDGDTNNPRVITLTQDTAFTAYFANNTYTLTVLSNDSVLGEVSGSTVCEYLDTVSITATTIMPHYHFVQWSDGNTEAVRNVVVTCDSVVTAIFAIDTHSVVIAVNNDNYGTVTDGYNVPYGNTVTIEAFASEGYHFAEWSNGSRNNPDNITIVSDSVIIAIFTADVVPQICMVSVQNGYNTVIWEKGLKVASYNIYREGNTANQYELVSTVSYDSLSTWVDSTSNPRSRSYRYRMTATDIYGYESEAGDVHKTMHLTINKGIGNQWNLVWTEYEGAPYTTYVIYRGTNASNIQQIDVMPAGGNTTYTDENAQEGDVYYQVGVMMSSPCNPSKSSSIIMSNIATNGNVGIQNIDLTGVNIFSRMGEIIVENSSGKPIQVLDVLGRTIYLSNNISYNDYQVTISVPKSGVYLVKVGDCPTKKVVVVK